MYASNVSVKLTFVAALIDQGYIDQCRFMQTLDLIEKMEPGVEVGHSSDAHNIAMEQIRQSMRRSWGRTTTVESAYRRLGELFQNGKLHVITTNYFVLDTQVAKTVARAEVA